MAYKDARRVEPQKAGGESAGRRKVPERRWRLVNDDFVRTRQYESLAKLSHDIRNQLYIIIGYAELMLEEIPGKINDAQRHNLKDVLNSGKRLQTMLDNIVGPPGNSSSKTGNRQPARGVK